MKFERVATQNKHGSIWLIANLSEGLPWPSRIALSCNLRPCFFYNHLLSKIPTVQLIAGAIAVLILIHQSSLPLDHIPHSFSEHPLCCDLSKQYHDDSETIKSPSRVKVPLLRRHSCPSCIEACWKSNIHKVCTNERPLNSLTICRAFE